MLRSKRWLECGFLGHDGTQEVIRDERVLLARGEQEPARRLRCRRNLWPRADQMNLANIMDEVTQRRRCADFQGYSPGKSPDDHYKLEAARHRLRERSAIAAVSLLIGGLISWLIRCS